MPEDIREITIPNIKDEKKPRRRDDELWKGILEDVFEDFLRFFFPNADELFDLQRKFSFMDKEFNRLFPPEENSAGVRYVDKLVKVHLKNGQQKFFLVHVEVQGQKGTEDLGLRMFRYFYRAKDKHNVSITAFAVLIDEVKNYHPKTYEEDYLGTQLSYKFNTYKLLDQEETALRANPNPFAVVALVVLMALKHKHINDDGLKLIKLDLTKELIKRNVSKSKHVKIMDFLAYYVNFKNPKMMIKFEEEVEQLTGRSKPMGVREILLERREQEGIQKGINQGIQQGINQGINQGEHKKAVEMALKLKQKSMPLEEIAELTGLSREEIQEI